MSYREIPGDLIEYAKAGQFDVIGHGCNCFCRMKRGIAPLMAAAFGCDKFPLENALRYEGDVNKLGQIDYQIRALPNKPEGPYKDLVVVNMYSQYHWTNQGKGGIPLDYDALAMCLRKMNMLFPGRRIGLPKIGCGLAGGDWMKVQPIILGELKDCDVTILIK